MNCTKPDIRSATVLVIRKDGKYLSRSNLLTGEVIWDQHLGSAWRTRNKEDAAALARVHGGELMLFNPIVWKVKDL